MDKAPKRPDAARRDAAMALRQAAEAGERERRPFARTRFRVILTGGTPVAADHGHAEEDGR